MNKCVIIGTLCHDLEPKTSQSGTSLVSFRLAVRRKYKNADGKYDSDFINCKAFKNNADYLAKYAKKGDKLAVEGNIQTGSYTNKNGVKVYTTDVMVDNVEVIGGGKSEGFKELKDEPLPWEE